MPLLLLPPLLLPAAIRWHGCWRRCRSNDVMHPHLHAACRPQLLQQLRGAGGAVAKAVV